MPRLLFSLLCSAFLAGQVSAQAPVSFQDTLAYTTASLRLREKPFPTARALAVLPQGTAVRFYSCSQGWCSVAVSQLAGYLLEEFLSAQAPRAATSQGRGYINSQGEWVPSPTRTADGKPPEGATAHCRDGTFSFSHTRQGTCSHHGGVAEWLRE
jgi:uncharacterized protein YraI